MIYQLKQIEFTKVESLVKQSNQELTIRAVIHGTSPGEIYVDNIENPLSTLIFTTECNVVAGKADNKEFNNGVKETLDFFDPIICDDESWENNIHDIHPNIAIRKYIRRYYELDQLKYIDFKSHLDPQYTLEYLNSDNLNLIDYENSEKLRDWIKLVDINAFKGSCLGSFIRKENKIVSMSLIDCIIDDRIEIGIHTQKEYRKNGLAAIAAAATVYASLLDGIHKIGWHCVDSNIGSIKTAEKVGFHLVKKYSSFTPYPPIENDTDLNKDQWCEWATYYTEMNQIQPYYYWLAAQCWAKAVQMDKTIENIMKLIETKQMWFVDYLPDIDAFKAFEDKPEWKEMINRIVK